MVTPPLSVEPEVGLSVEEVGTILGVADGIAWVEGLPSVPVGEVLRSADGSRAWVDGPLVRAMLEGRRFKVEEPNRMPASMLCGNASGAK